VQRFSDIIERVERVRMSLKLNKSQFAKLVGLTPQTYNNFVGAQGSKPNVELLHGIVTQVGVNPLWVLTGKGSIFMGKPADSVSPLARIHRMQEEVAESVSHHPAEDDPHRAALASLEPLLLRVEEHLRRIEVGHSPLLNRLQSVLAQYLKTNPDDVKREVEELLKRVEGHLVSKAPTENSMSGQA
jgi:transcriptional regulator with XRE-family HTH domain